MKKKMHTISPDSWNQITERIYHGVGTEIGETRRIQFHLRYALSFIAVAITFVAYSVALWLA
jgi:hypothetical protein